MPPLRSAPDWTRFAVGLYEGVSEATFLSKMTVKLENGLGLGLAQWNRIDRTTLTVSDTTWSKPTPPSLNAEYERNYAPHDPRIKSAFQNFGQFLPCWRLVDSAEFEKSIIVNEWSDRRDVAARWTAVCIWGIDKTSLGLLAFCRPRKDGPIQMEELRIVKRLRSHVRRAAQLHHLFRDEPPRGRAFDDAWNSRSQAVFLMGKGRRLLSMNHAAQSPLELGDVFHTRWGELSAREHRLAATLDNALAAARKFDLAIYPRPIAFAWPRFGGEVTLRTEILALHGVVAELGMGEQAEAVIICRDVPHRSVSH